MPIQTPTSDLDKLLSAFASLQSAEDIFDVFGVGNLPQAQKYGILLGITTFVVTVSSVIGLLVAGGSFKRIADQAEDGVEVSIPNSIEERLGRPLLLERLLEASERMRKSYRDGDAVVATDGGDGDKRETKEFTILTKMLMNIAPDVEKAQAKMAGLVEENKTRAKKNRKNKKKSVQEKMKEVDKLNLNEFVPQGYEQHYIEAYRKCHEQPGGSTLPGLPEARPEAYARAYAACGSHTTTPYRRSYARAYEAIACTSHATEFTHRERWIHRPSDIVGRTIRLEALEWSRHGEEFWRITSGEAVGGQKGYDPSEVWSFEEEGPFEGVGDLEGSFVFLVTEGEAKFAIVDNVTEGLLGVVRLTRDDPRNLTISLELPIVTPSNEGTVESIEGCFLLLDRLFAHGYRRVQLSVDSMDTVGKKLCGRLGFTQEGTICKDRIVKESNRDSIVYGLLNSDWDKGARAFLFKKLHGDKAMKLDKENNDKEEELEVQNNFLADKKAKVEKKSKKI